MKARSAGAIYRRPQRPSLLDRLRARLRPEQPEEDMAFADSRLDELVALLRSEQKEQRW